MSSNELSFQDLVIRIKSIITNHLKVFIGIAFLSLLLAFGIILKNKISPEYKARMLIGSEVLNISILKVLVNDLNIQFTGNTLNEKFGEQSEAINLLQDINVKSINVKEANEKDKALKIYEMELVFAEVDQKAIDFDQVTSVLFKDIVNKANDNVFIAESKAEIQRNLANVDSSIHKAYETEASIRKNLSNNGDVSLIGITQFYTDLNSLETRKSSLEKNLVFYQDDHLVYKLTEFSFDYNQPKKIEIIAYCLFLGFFLSFIFIVFKLTFSQE